MNQEFDEDSFKRVDPNNSIGISQAPTTSARNTSLSEGASRMRQAVTDKLLNMLYRPTEAQKQERKHFDAKYLGADSSSHDFLKEIVDYVPLHDLKQVVQMSHDDQNLSFGAILIEVKNAQLRSLYTEGKRYSLEIWCRGRMVYHRPLERKVRAWSTSRRKNTLIFLLDENDCDNNQGEIIHVVSLNNLCNPDFDLKDSAAVAQEVTHLKIYDWSDLCSNQANHKHMSFGLDKNDTLYISTLRQMHAVSIKDIFSAGINSDVISIGNERRRGMCDFNNNFRMMKMYDTCVSYAREDGLSVIGLFDRKGVAGFNRICVEEDAEDAQKLNIVLKQVVKPLEDATASTNKERTTFKNYRHIVLKDGQEATIVVRMSGQADLYWNCKKISSTENQNVIYKYTQINANFQGIILRRQREGAPMDDRASHVFDGRFQEHLVRLSLQQKQRTSFEDLTVIAEFGDLEKDFFNNQAFSTIVSPFQEFVLLDEYILVSHECIISIYSLQRQSWVQHYRFDDAGSENLGLVSRTESAQGRTGTLEICRVFRSQGHSEEYFKIDVLLSSGCIKHLAIDKESAVITIAEEDVAVQGRILSSAYDREHNRILYFITEDNGQVELKGYANQTLTTLDARVSEQSCIVPYFAPAAATQVVIVEPERNCLSIYEQKLSESDLQLTFVQSIIVENLSETIDTKSLHSVVSTEGEKVMILFNEVDMIVCDLQNATKQEAEDPESEAKIYGLENKFVYAHKNVGIRGLQLIEDRHLYVMSENMKQGHQLNTNAISQEGRSRMANISGRNGLGYMDLDSLLDDASRKPHLVEIMPALCGINSQITFDEATQQLVIEHGFNSVCILPLLHRNLLPLKGIKSKDSYLFARQYEDKFVALESQKNFMQVWDMQTGKHLLEKNFKIAPQMADFQHKEANNADFKVFRSLKEQDGSYSSLQDEGVLPYSLLYFSQADERVTDASFYGNRIQTEFAEISAMAATQKEFCHFVAVALDEPYSQQLETNRTILTDVKVQVSFVYPRVLDREQNLFLSSDFTRLLDIREEEASIYRLVRQEGSTLARVEFEGDVKKLPFGSFDSDVNQLFYMFSPNFDLHIDFDPIKKQWLIRETLSGDLHFQIPDTFLSFNSKAHNQVFEQTRFLAWESNTALRLIDVNADPFVHELIRVPARSEGTTCELSLEKSSGTVPYLDIEPYQQKYKNKSGERKTGVYNYFKGNLKIDLGDVKSRLKRMQTILKTAWYLQAEKDDNLELQTVKQDAHRFQTIYRQLFRVDHVSDEKHHQIELPFTFIMWRQIEKLKVLTQQSSLQAATVCLSLPFSRDIAQTMSLTILPGVKTVLHEITRNYEFLEYFMGYAMQPEAEGDEEPFILPFIEDLYGKTALHQSMGQRSGDEHPSLAQIMIDLTEENEKHNQEELKASNSRSTELLLTQLLPNTPLDHHGRAVADLIPVLISQELPYLGTYLDSRWKQSRQLEKLCRQDDKKLRTNLGCDEGEFVDVVDLWPDERLVTERMFEKSDKGQEVEFFILDLPYLHQPTEKSAQELAKALAEVEDTSIFKLSSIRSILTFRWAITRDYVIRKQLLWYVAFFFIYLVYCFFILPLDGKWRADHSAEVLQGEYPASLTVLESIWLIVLAGFALYFFWNEIKQLKKLKLSYFLDFWNYADFIPPVGIYVIILIDLLTSKQNDNARSIRYAIQAIVCFGMWVKIFYFLRVFRSTGYFVNMMFRVVSHSKVFFLLYMLILCAFAFTFFIAAPYGDNPIHFLVETYKIGLGADDIDFDGFPAPNMMKFIYLFGTLAITIVMLNLLIAIISSAYEMVIETQQEANDSERVQLIHEIAVFIDEETAAKLAKSNEYILRARIAKTASEKKKEAEEEE